jgi:hypothetical protein
LDLEGVLDAKATDLVMSELQAPEPTVQVHGMREGSQSMPSQALWPIQSDL